MIMSCNQHGQCSRRPDPVHKATDLVTLQGSVGRNGRNLSSDVKQVQNALNRVGPVSGGPLIPLVVDGFVGPKTIKAIEDFQRTQFPAKVPDGRIDPGQRTLGRLNELLAMAPAYNGGMLPTAASAQAAFVPQGNEAGPAKAAFVPPPFTTEEQMSRASRHCEDAEKRILAALKRMNQAILAMGKKAQTAKEKELVREINWHFKANADPDPAKFMAMVQFNLATMYTAIREHNLGTRNILRKGDPPPADPQAIAWAYLGGWHSMEQEKRFITITPLFMTQLSIVIVHELSHFCGGAHRSAREIIHRASPDPFPTGTQREDGSTNYRDMPPYHARTNVYSYTVYCYPDRPEFKVPAGV